ncbi:peptidase family M1-domain-containing protein [Calycina marina]|uniref:Aminopeptidase n=1 Tax=Calycina marina TaxID=1763456 RepID=A0A9P8CET8_9HELO|nr:peptidase family M1-domain-containing protein [Calycina marina]
MPQTTFKRDALPANVKPIHYELTIEPEMVEVETFEGSVVIHLDVLNATSSIVLNMRELMISDTKVISEQKEVKIKGLEIDATRELVAVFLEDELAASSKVELRMSFEGSLLHHSDGFYRSRYQGEDGTPKWMVSTSMEPIDARKVFPCFDEPALKATFAIKLVVDPFLDCLSNMPEVSSETVTSKGKTVKISTFGTTPPMSTYIVSCAIGEFNTIETNNFHAPIRVIAPRDHNIEHGRFCLELAARTLSFFEKMFDIAYPLPKMDLIAIPSAQTAMENWGLVTFNPTFLLVDELESSATAVHQAAGMLVHELAHQWLGNLVTMEFWDGLWLNEGFADWAQMYALDTLHPEWKIWEEYAVNGYQYALTLDSNRASHPVEGPILKATDVNQIFDGISYCKGSAILRMISTFLGIDKFLEGVRHYLKQHTYGNTRTDDLWASLSYVSGQDIGRIMEIWTKNPGYPVLSITEDILTNSIHVEQHRFIKDGHVTDEDDKVVYPIPLGLLTSNGVDDRMLQDRSAEIPVSLDLYKLNSRHMGFYLVAYPSSRLKILGQNVRDGLLTPEDKIGIMRDVMAISGSGLLNAKTTDVLQLLQQFHDETEYFVWKQISEIMKGIKSILVFENLKALERFEVQLFSSILVKKGWILHKSDSDFDRMLKPLVFAHSKETASVKKAAGEMFTAFMDGDEQAIDVNILEAVLTTVLRDGGSKEYDAILHAARTNSSLEKRNIFLGSLGAARDPSLIERTLALATSPEVVKLNNTTRVLNKLAEHSGGIISLWKWLRQNFDLLHAHLSSNGYGLLSIIELCTDRLVTEEHLTEVKDFFNNKDTSNYDKLLAQVLNTIETNNTWITRERENIRKWLAEGDI